MTVLNDSELASGLHVSISRLIKILRSEVRHDELLSLTERSTLSVIYQYSKILPSELAAIEKVTSQSMSQIINKLYFHGYIKRTPSVQDRRKVIITITSRGKEFIELKNSRSQEWLARAISDKTTEFEKEILRDAILVLTKLVD